MGFAYYISIENDALDVVSEVDGKAAANAIEDLDEIAARAGVPGLGFFLGQSLDEISDLMGEEIRPEEGVDPSAKWFQPKEGLAVIEALLAVLSTDSKRIKRAKAVVEDLEGYKAILQKADRAGVRWHLAMDF